MGGDRCLGFMIVGGDACETLWCATREFCIPYQTPGCRVILGEKDM